MSCDRYVTSCHVWQAFLDQTKVYIVQHFGSHSHSDQPDVGNKTANKKQKYEVSASSLLFVLNSWYSEVHWL